MSIVDSVWVAAAAALVMSMQVGFCMLETGLVRSKNTINVAFKNLMDFCLAGLLFWAISYALMFGPSPSGWLGTGDFFFSPAGAGAPEAMHFLFQMMFCATAATIVSGAVAERMSFRGYLAVTVLISGFIYPIAGGWIWNSQGWLKELGFVDFAGATVVHSVGGWMALAAAFLIGPRIGRFDSKVALASPHSLVTSTLGILILFVGWLGFNGGSTMAINDQVPGILINTVLGGCAGCLSAMAMAWKRSGMPLLPETLNGCLAGLVSVTAACPFLTAPEAVLIGAVGGLLSVMASGWLVRLRIDDVVGASAAHAFPGVWGTIAVGLFADAGLLGTGLGFWQQLGVQILGCLTVALWAGGGGWLLLYGLNRILPLRTDLSGETAGLNVSEHGASTEIIDLLSEMSRHSGDGDFTSRVDFQPFTEVGQIASEYNKVIGKVIDEMDLRESIAERLASERQALEKTQSSIISSIEYARRIQEALLPTPANLQKLFPDNFTLYRPRDIVSGDFYWAAAMGDARYVAVVDCTGHGVPGALMAMIGYVLLQQIVIERGTQDPAMILTEFHHRIRLALGQNREGNDNQDGMEIGLIRVDEDRIVFAGAGLPLWWRQGGNGRSTQGEIAGDRHGIGGGRHEPSSLTFSQHSLPRRPGLSVYLASDGLLHQCDHARRMLDKSGFRKWVLEAGEVPVSEQEAWFAARLDQHSGGATQRDDITLLGLDVSPTREISARP